ncbi:hypothetical protein PPYR_08869 [Photinus pyralis]|uniref:Symplekin n=1 Tax=Photinus pyralis TaxID=7054 RepID=A0A5N4AKQ1_PHOPY|nr:symplekin [Photinus pyralis]KAB0797876.1 hypothetical protein PPYR_08869 [Photinus pyralis]
MDYMNAEISDRDLILQWINTASFSQNSKEKLDILHKLQEFLIRKAPSLLPEFLENVLGFTTDKSPDIKKALVAFIEEACKTNECLLPKVILSLHMLLCVDSIPVQKRVIQAAITIYRRMLSWLCKASVITPEMEQAWNQLNVIKVEIVNMIDSDNDGVRTSSVKFLECVVLLQTYPDPYETRSSNNFSLDDVPLTLKIARRRKLEEEANKIFDLLIKFNGSQHVSSANLFACIGALANIARQRPEFMGKVIAGIELLHSNMPPTLSSTQVNSVRKKLKTELCSLIKHHASFDYLESLTTMLVELGYSMQELERMLPKADERRRYVKRSLNDEQLQPTKRPRLEQDPNSEQQKLATDINEKFVLEKLNIDIAVQLVLKTLPKLPQTMPNQFKIDYSAFIKMGHVGELKVLGKMVAIQLLEAGLGPGAEKFLAAPPAKEKSPVIEIRAKKKEEEESLAQKKERPKVPRIKTLKLAEITKPLEKSNKEVLLLGTVQRILMAEKTASTQLRQKVIVTLASSFGEVVRASVLAFLLTDLRSYLDIALAWLFEEYSIMQGFTRLPAMRRDGRLDQGYTTLLGMFINVASGDALVLSRIMLEAPMITDQALDQLCVLCKDVNRCAWALGLIKDLVIRRPPKQSTFLNALLIHTTHEQHEVRECAINHLMDLYKRPNLKGSIDKFVQLHLDFLRLAQPPMSLFGESQGRLMGGDSWNDDLVRCCLMPYVSLLPINQTLIHNLAKVYVQTNADIKRIILRLLEPPIRVMGMESAELLKLVEECPKGSETLVTRVIHILTDKGHPSTQLVQRVRELYQTRVSDVRFLIPVLNGLTKQEIISALPKLIKLNPVVVREVFNRLLGLHGESPITPTELLVALHLIDPSKADLKTTMKATSMCLNEKQVFTQEVLAVVLQQLMDQTPLPTLLMRTVIQALSSHPRLSGFVMNILQRLILKQVWKQKVVWEGFVKCCLKTRPQSFSVLMQLPAVQLTEALGMCPEIRDPLRQYLQNFTEGQRSHIPSAVQEVLVDLPNALIPQKPPEMVPAPVINDPLPPPVLGSMEPLPPGME